MLSQIRRIAEDYRSRTEERPDCFNASEELQTIIQENLPITDEHINIAQYVINGYYRHYVLHVYNTDDSQWYVVDVTFDQFAIEEPTDINVAPADDLQPVVITKKSEYIFEV